MLVANSFDLWQKDTFFSAAEEVQRSADTMQSIYRTWLRAGRDGLPPQHLDELSRDLHMALGTTKWQLEEFEKAVRLSYGKNGDDITITRHKQFVSAIDSQISRIQVALKESSNMEGKKPFRWVNLDKQECDDLTLFLSDTPLRIKNEGIIPRGPVATSSLNDIKKHSEVSSEFCSPNHWKSSLEIQESKSHAGEISCLDDQITTNQRARISPDRVELEIVIDNDGRRNNALIEITPKEKGFKPFFWRSRRENWAGARTKMMNWFTWHLRGGHRSQRQLQMSTVLPVNSIRFMLALMLTMFLVVPFLIHST